MGGKGSGRHRVPHIRKARCHPGRWAVQGEWCADCVPRQPTVFMADGPTPPACPHCHAPPPTWHTNGDLDGRCVACGQRWQRGLMTAYL